MHPLEDHEALLRCKFEAAGDPSVLRIVTYRAPAVEAAPCAQDCSRPAHEGRNMGTPKQRVPGEYQVSLPGRDMVHSWGSLFRGSRIPPLGAAM